MRGLKNLYDTYLETAPPKGKGRSAVEITRRNNLLSARFYYHMHIKRKRFDDILSSLNEEFFISESRIVDLLNENKPLLDNFMNTKPEPRELKKEFAWFVWD
ncbi:MAG: hypothetical protein CVU09_09505 [Bacteroidetes bacterium HGW-Bacteroidetes-4]|jgi:hypothetical protein|nr:MAG: hypothetical protein CVU09_09505 [Bacteroidetes bacterium HGW-Bacteroidetes-4]